MITPASDLFERLAEHPADAVALVDTRGHQVTYAELRVAVDRYASGFIRAGLQPGDRVLFAVRPRLDAYVLILALQRAGAVVVALEPGTGGALFANRLALIQPRWVIAESIVFTLAALADHRLGSTLLRLARIALPFPNLASLRGLRLIRVGRRVPGVPREAQLPLEAHGALDAVPTDNPLFIVFTSGTTDAPKAVVHTHASVAATVALLVQHLRLDPSARVYTDEVHLMWPTLHAGATAVIPTRPRLADDLARFSITHVFGLPSKFQQLIGLGRRLPASLQVVLLGSAPVDRAFLGRFREIVPAHTSVWCVYGMTEMLPICAVSLDAKLGFSEMGDLVGAPLPEVHVRLTEDSELLVRGPNLFSNYVGGPPVTEHATGDLASFDPLGRVVLRGRKKDMIIRDGHNIYPALLEPLIRDIDGVRDCALIGNYSERLADERVTLAVEPASGCDTSALRRRLSPALQQMDALSHPDRIVFTMLPRVGRSAEIDRGALRVRFACE